MCIRDRSFEIYVNHQPVIVSSPPISALVGEVFKYNIIVEDKNKDADLLFTLTKGPQGMQMSKKGKVVWIPKSAQINEIAIKASAGAIQNINICREDSLESIVKTAKSSGLAIIACSEKGEKNIDQIDFKKPTLILIGSEKNGISKPLLKLSDEIGKIPVLGKTSSLNASVATGIIIFEHNRQQLN